MVDDFLTFFVAGNFKFNFSRKFFEFFNNFYLLFEGQETTANTLAFAILELGRNAQVLKK